MKNSSSKPASATIAARLVLLFGVGCVGCHSKVDSMAQGTVTIDGELADHGTVAFHPTSGGALAYGNIAKDGSYSVRIGQGKLNNPDASMIPSGEYVVTVVINQAAQKGETMGDAGPPKPGPRLTAEKYSATQTSPLRVTVKQGMNVLPLDLESASHAGDAQTAPMESPAVVAPSETDAKPSDGEKGEAKQ